MKTIEEVIDKLNECGITVSEYDENKILLGYDLNTYTDGGVNQSIFIDFRNTELNPTSAEDFMTLYNERIESIDIDEEIEYNREGENYKRNFSLSESVEDFINWKVMLENVFVKQTKTAQQRQFEQTKDKFQSLLAQMEEVLELMPVKGNTTEDCQRTNISNHLCGLDSCFNGIELEDFTPNSYSSDWELSYS